MLARLVRRSIQHRRGAFVLTLVAVAVGAALAAALLGVGFAVGERMAAEMRGFGANIVVVPRAEPLEVAVGSVRYIAEGDEAYLEEAALGRLKTIFWRHNIVALAPSLARTVRVGTERALLVGTWFDREVAVPDAPRRFAFATGARRDVGAVPPRWRTGLRTLAASWDVNGAWVTEGSGGALVGRALAARLGLRVGDRLSVDAGPRSASFPVVGIVTTGGPEDDEILVELAQAQALFGLPGQVDRVRVSALVTPDNALAERARRAGPERLPAAEYETWYCTPYLDSIMFQLEEALPGARARAIRQVADAERAFLGSLTLTLSLVTAVGLLACGVAVGAALARTALERRREVGVMKALGADRHQIALVFVAEATVAGLGGGALGSALGAVLARVIGEAVFAIPITVPPLLLPVVLLVSVVIALLGTVWPLRAALAVDAVTTLAEA